MHSFKKNDRVAVINQTWGGKYIVEGWAIILKPIEDMDEQYRVRFLRNGKPQLGEEYDRFIDPDAQKHPERFVTRLNQICEKVNAIA